MDGINIIDRIAVIACDVLKLELTQLCQGLSYVKECTFLPMGLHDRPEILRRELQVEIDRLEKVDSVDRIILVYGLCGNGTAGLIARSKPLVITRAHDCITLFMGSKERFKDYQSKNPGAFFYIPGWMRGERVPGPERLESLRAQYQQQFDDEDDVDYLIDMELESWRAHGKATYLDLGVGDLDRCRSEVQSSSDWLKWEVEYLDGDSRLIRALLTGDWSDDQFLIVPPGEMIKSTGDDSIIKSVTCQNCNCADED